MNKLISMIGAAIVTVTVFLFALFLAVDLTFGSYLVCMFLPMGYIMMAAGLREESGDDRRVAANIGMVFAGIYATLILLVYFAQTTSVHLGGLSEDVISVLDFRRGGLIFNYDLLGYGMMVLSTFFIGLSMRAYNTADKWLKALMMIHGLFFPGCFIMPMTGIIGNMSDGSTSKGGIIALICWCGYFLPIGILGFVHFWKKYRRIIF